MNLSIDLGEVDVAWYLPFKLTNASNKIRPRNFVTAGGELFRKSKPEAVHHLLVLGVGYLFCRFPILYLDPDLV